MSKNIEEVKYRVKNVKQFMNEQKNNTFYGLFSRVKKTRTNIVIDENTIDDVILNDDVLKDKVEFYSNRGGNFILFIKQDYNVFNNLLKFRIENELGLVFDKTITDKNMLS